MPDLHVHICHFRFRQVTKHKDLEEPPPLFLFRNHLSTITANEYFERLHRIVSILNKDNINIIRTMKKEGPRNLQNVARASKVPYTTVHSRVKRLEAEGILNTGIHPNYSRIGLSQGNVLITPFPGKEIIAREAARIPGYWLKIARCIGDTNGYFVLVAIPSANIRDYEEYFEQLVARGIIKNYRISWLEESFSPIPNFDYYNLENKTWRFDWPEWTALFQRRNKDTVRKVPKSRTLNYDKRDLIILKELVKDARVTLSHLAKMLSVTLPAAKYRFDSLTEKGLIEDYIISILPFAAEISELLEVRLDFRDEALSMQAKHALSRLPFVLTYCPVRGMNSVTVRIYIPRVETNRLLSLLSQLLRKGVLTNYSYLQLDSMTLQWSTFGYKDYNDDAGWFYDNKKYLQAIENLVSNWPRHESDPLTRQTPAPILAIGIT